MADHLLQDWVRELSFMQQSVLLASIRAPDTLGKNHPAKKLYRWYRRCILVCAFCKKVHETPEEFCEGSFTGPLTQARQVARDYLVDVDAIPHHAHLHLLHAAQIIGAHCPRGEAQAFWLKFYFDGVHDMHLNVENTRDMDLRLSDNPNEWKKRETFPANKE